MKELPLALIVVGFAIVLTGGAIMLWATIQISNLERAQDFVDEWDVWWEPYQGLVDEEYERQRDYYSALRIAGAVGLVAGLPLIIYGFVLLRQEPAPVAPVPSVPNTVPGVANFCEFCGRQISPGAVRCPGCGRSFPHKGREIGTEQEVH